MKDSNEILAEVLNQMEEREKYIGKIDLYVDEERFNQTEVLKVKEHTFIRKEKVQEMMVKWEEQRKASQPKTFDEKEVANILEQYHYEYVDKFPHLPTIFKWLKDKTQKL